MPVKLSVIIVNYNVRYFLEQCLLSVYKSLGNMEAEVFVVDNNSVDGSMDMVREKFPAVKRIANRENTGFAKANNQAIRQASGEYVLLLNPDTVVQEDTFRKVIDFMDGHAEAGGLGVQMIDGKGRFLPESKRGLPTPFVAFSKITGLSWLFPKSKWFGRYHLGYLDRNKTHPVDVLSGAFMLLRKSVLDKAGLLDETFFMYGEDIDLSYRIQKAGYKNYYFSETRIIHYKGESTRKSSVNYVIVFYKAMVIFARKHFSQQHARIFSFLISVAVWMRAGAALMARLASRFLLPLADGLIIYAGMYVLKNYWETSVKQLNYPPMFLYLVVPLYVCIWIFSSYLSGGYDKPVRISKINRGIISGTVFILVVYALLPEHFRFSRALILIGTLWAMLAVSSLRVALSFTGNPAFAFNRDRKKRIVIAAGSAEGNRILSLLQLSGASFNFLGFVRPGDEPAESTTSLGNLTNLKEVIEIYEAEEIIFSSGDITARQIIMLMQSLNKPGVEFKIAPPESMYIIGSNSINEQGDLYLVDVNALNNPVNRRKKRLLDLLICAAMIPAMPVLVFAVDRFSHLMLNWMNVLVGKYSWVGLTPSTASARGSFRSGILTPLDALTTKNIDPQAESRLNVLYAKEYSVYTDLKIILRGIKYLGRKV